MGLILLYIKFENPGAGWVIVAAFGLVWLGAQKGGWVPWNQLLQGDSKDIRYLGLGLLASLVLLHFIFH